MKKSLPELYDHFAATYDAHRNEFDMSEVLHDFHQQLSVKQGRLLDLGCGAGEPLARYFVDLGWQVQGVDFSAQMLQLAGRYVPEMKTRCADMRRADFERQSFDAITAFYSLFHLPTKDHPALFKKCCTWLKPGGRFLFTYASREYTGCDHFNGYKKFLGQELFYGHETPQTLYRQLQEAGLTLVRSDYRKIGGEVFLWVTCEKALSGV